MAVEMSASSRGIRCGCISTTVTAAPKRRNICANSSPTYEPPTTTRCSGTRSSARIELLSRCGTSPTPGMRGTAARPPTLMKMRGADSTSSPTRTCVGDSKRRARAAPCSPHAAQPVLDAAARARHHGVGARLDARHVHGDGALDDDAVVARAARQVRGVGAGDQRLGGHAPGVDARPAEQRPLDQRHLHAGAREPPGERRPRLPRADDDGVERRHSAAAPISTAPPIATASSISAAG